MIRSRLAGWLSGDDRRWLVDSLPIEACEFARATSCGRIAGEADYGDDHLRKRTYDGLRLHLRTSREGVIEAFTVTPALEPPPGRAGIGDRGYYDPEMRRRLEAAGVPLHAPYYQKGGDPEPKRSSRAASLRYRIETVKGRLADRYGIKRTWAWDVWHLIHRITRKILGHTVMIWLNVLEGNPPPSFDRLRSAA